MTATLALRFFNCVPLINRYVKYRDLSRAIKAHPSPRLSEASDSGAFGGDCSVVPVDSLPLELEVVGFIVVRYILVLFDPIVSLTVFVELFEVGACVSVVALVLAGCVVFGVGDFGVSVFVRLLWWFDSGCFDVGVGVHVSPGTVKQSQLKVIVVFSCNEMSNGFTISFTVSELCNGMVSTMRHKTKANRAYSIFAPV